jgi:hypothetical protein
MMDLSQAQLRERARPGWWQGFPCPSFLISYGTILHKK